MENRQTRHQKIGRKHTQTTGLSLELWCKECCCLLHTDVQLCINAHLFIQIQQTFSFTKLIFDGANCTKALSLQFRPILDLHKVDIWPIYINFHTQLELVLKMSRLSSYVAVVYILLAACKSAMYFQLYFPYNKPLVKFVALKFFHFTQVVGIYTLI